MERFDESDAIDSSIDASSDQAKSTNVRFDKKGRRIYTLEDFKKMDEFILPTEPEWAAEWERRTGLKAQP